MPRFSIIVPAYNASDYIAECMDSLLAQTYADLEVVVVNDGSSDDTLTILNRYASADPRVRVIDKPNGGVSSARNAAIDAAAGEWLVFADADDRYTAGALELFARLSQDAPDVDMVCASSESFGEGMEPAPFVQLPDAMYDDAVGPLTHFALWGYALRRDIAERNHLRFHEDVRHSEDRCFLLEYAINARRLVTSSERVYQYRRSATQATRSQDGLRIARHELIAADYIFDLLGNNHALSPLAAAGVRGHGMFTVWLAFHHFYTRPNDKVSRRQLLGLYAAMRNRPWPLCRARMLALRLHLKQMLKRLLGKS